MPVFALYNLNDAGSTAADSALGNGAQNGVYINGAVAGGGQAQLDGLNDLVKIYQDPAFQMDRGTLDIQFSLSDEPQNCTQTVLSRDSAGQTPGGYHIDVLQNGAVVISHETPTGTTSFGTEPGFAQPGDEIKLTYSWDQGGTGGALVIDNLTTNAGFNQAVPNTLTMDMGAINQPWIIGAGQSTSNPDVLNNINQHFAGSVEVFSLSDTVDNTSGPDAVDDTATTPEDTAITIPVLTNDTNPSGTPLTVTTATAPNGSVVINPNGTISYTPNPNFNGPDVISYSITDPAGNTDTATVAVNVTPVPDAPEANPDTATTAQGTPITIPVLGNDTDPDGTLPTLLGTPTSANGTITVNPNGTIVFTPTPGFVGTATIDYTITDPTGLTDTSTVTVTVTPVGTAPDGIVRGTAGDNLIDRSYIDPFDTDRVDAGDAFLAGDAPNDDRILAGAGNDTVLAGLGDDSIEGGDGNDSLRGNQGDDTIFGQGGNDTLRGEDGNDSLIGGDGNDRANGGDGDDVINTSGSASPLPDLGYPGLYPADTNPTNDLDTVYGGTGNDTITTGDDADLIFGGFGDDSINGGIDADTIDGNQGNDTIIGGEGSDVISAGQGDDLVYGGLGPTFPDNINIPDTSGDLVPGNGRDDIFGGMGNDTIFGLDDDDTIDGGQGNDLIDGGVDDDLIRGNVGNDTITGGQGVDTLSGGNDRDTFLVGPGVNAIGDVIDGNEGGDDFDTLDLRGTGPYSIVYADDNPENGVVTFRDPTTGAATGTLTFTNIENVIPCFTPGTMIATPKGEVAAEYLKAGDKIITRDNGIQEIRWVGQKAMGWRDLHVNPHLKPVLIRQGSLGNGLPERDMLVSPNHRVLVANDRTALYFDEHEVLVAAKHLVSSAGIAAVDSVGTTYIHFMFDRHEVVLSNGAWTESFQPGDYTLKGMGNAQRAEIFELFPDLKSEAGLQDYQAARRTLKRHEALLLVR